MPKKHTPSYSTTKPQSTSHASLTTRPRANSENGNHGGQTVNTRLAQLRASQQRATIKTPPPPEAALPTVLSEPGREQGVLLRNARRAGRIAGPPPPRSWIDPRIAARGLEHSQHAPKRIQDDEDVAGLPYQPPPILPGQPLPRRGSLVEMAMKVLARTLSEHIEYIPELANYLTPRMKAELLIVMTTNPPSVAGNLTQGKLRYLFGPVREEDGSWSSGGDRITHLSLGPVIRSRVDYNHLAENLRRTSPKSQEAVPDSWDEVSHISGVLSEPVVDAVSVPRHEEHDDEENQIHVIPKGLWLPLLPSLTHLSLAQPASPCWSSLLDVGGLDCLSQLTHLDLSYWPAPTLQFLTHGSKITPFQGEAERLIYYGEQEKEQIRVFNRLGKACRTLIWLGLEGCESWLPCLGAMYEKPVAGPRSRYDIDSGTRKDNLIRVDWTGVWRGLKTVRAVQSWVPSKFIDDDGSDLLLDPFVYKHLNADSSYKEWWGKERLIRRMDIVVAEWRLAAGQSPVKFEKTYIPPWLEFEIIKFDPAHAGEAQR